jgi:hypothetical protein
MDLSVCHPQGTVVNAAAFGVEWVAQRCSPAVDDLVLKNTGQAFCATFRPLFAFIVGAVCGAPAAVAFSYYALAVPIALILFIMLVLGAERRALGKSSGTQSPGTTSRDCPCEASSILQQRVKGPLQHTPGGRYLATSGSPLLTRLHSPLSESDGAWKEDAAPTTSQTAGFWTTTGSRPVLEPHQSRDPNAVTF